MLAATCFATAVRPQLSLRSSALLGALKAPVTRPRLTNTMRFPASSLAFKSLQYAFRL